MSAPSLTQPSVYSYPADVLAFAEQKKVQQYLDPLVEATRKLFPKITSLTISVEADPELRDERHIVFELKAPKESVRHFVQAEQFWASELFRICPAPLVCFFQLILLRIPASPQTTESTGEAKAEGHCNRVPSVR